MKFAPLTVLLFGLALTLRAADAPKADDSKKAAPAVSENRANLLKGEAVVDFLDYRLAVREKIDKKWNDYFEKYGASLKNGRAAFQIYVSSAGVVSIIQQTVGHAGGPIGALGTRAILESQGSYPPYPDSIKVQYPKGYFDEITFIVK